MTGFARVNGQVELNGENISWVWEAKSVNGKSLELKARLPLGYDDLGLVLKNQAAEYLVRGNVNVGLELCCQQNCKKVVVDEVLLEELTKRAVDLASKYEGKVGIPNAAELLGLRGVVEIETGVLSPDEEEVLRKKILADFVVLCQDLQRERQEEGQKIKDCLLTILAKIEQNVNLIEQEFDGGTEKLKQKLTEQIAQFKEEISISDDRIAQELVLLVTRADIREEVDRLKAHIKAAKELLDKDEVVGRRLDFLCQELNREANTTCSKSCSITITNLGMDLKALIEQFREQVQNIE